MVGNLTKKNKKCQMHGGQPGGGGWGDMGTLGIYSYIIAQSVSSIQGNTVYELTSEIDRTNQNDRNAMPEDEILLGS